MDFQKKALFWELSEEGSFHRTTRAANTFRSSSPPAPRPETVVVLSELQSCARVEQRL